MKTYSVGFSYTTIATMDIEANSKEEAEDKASYILLQEGIPALVEGINEFNIEYSEVI